MEITKNKQNKVFEKYQLVSSPTFDECLNQKDRLARLIKNLQITKSKSKSKIQKREIEAELSVLIGLRKRAREICRGSYNKSTPRNRQESNSTTDSDNEKYASVDYGVNSDEENNDMELTSKQYLNRLEELAFGDDMNADERDEF